MVDNILREEMERPVLIEGEEWIFPTEGKSGRDWAELK
jgi:hypothetical protein